MSRESYRPQIIFPDLRLPSLPAAFRRFALSPILLLLTGCTNTITPPASPPDPVNIFLLDHGRHPTLVLPQPEGGYTRYAYGAWGWYALGKASFFNVFPTLLWPNQGALGRRDAPSLQSILDQDPAEKIFMIQISREAVDRLRTHLDAVFEQNRSSLHTNEAYHLEFVHDPGRYHAFHNCNHVAAHWLRELGCRVNGCTMFSSWRLRQPHS